MRVHQLEFEHHNISGFQPDTMCNIYRKCFLEHTLKVPTQSSRKRPPLHRLGSWQVCQEVVASQISNHIGSWGKSHSPAHRTQAREQQRTDSETEFKRQITATAKFRLHFPQTRRDNISYAKSSEYFGFTSVRGTYPKVKCSQKSRMEHAFLIHSHVFPIKMFSFVFQLDAAAGAERT